MSPGGGWPGFKSHFLHVTSCHFVTCKVGASVSCSLLRGFAEEMHRELLAQGMARVMTALRGPCPSTRQLKGHPLFNSFKRPPPPCP